MKPSTVILVHWCPSNVEKANNPSTRDYDKHRMPRIEEQLQEKGIEVLRPLLPTPWERVYVNFKEAFEKIADKIDENTVLVGHSCGSAFLVRWLGENKKQVAKLILVAPRKIFDGKKIKKKPNEDLYDYDINPEVKERVGEIIMFTSNDEEPTGKESLQLFHEVLGGKIIELAYHGHYTMWDMGTEEFPELLEQILIK